jgi:imidazolonepropionase-like amidohydrolase
MVTDLPARAIGLGHETGSLARGKAADLLVVRGNPLDSLRALRQVEAVFCRGRQVV